MTTDEPEKRPEKRMKIGDSPKVDTAKKLESTKDGGQYCMICKCNTDHDQWDCPDRSKGMGMGCVKCFQPCEIEEHKKDFIPIYKYCLRCEVNGEHWNKDCPDPIYDDNDMYY